MKRAYNGAMKEKIIKVSKVERKLNRELEWAVFSGDRQRVYSSIKKGANPNATGSDVHARYLGMPMLSIALAKNNVGMAQTLWENGAKTNKLDNERRDALMIACEEGSTAGALWAIKFFKPEDAFRRSPNGMTALMWAARHQNNAELITKLMELYDPKAVDSAYKASPLMWAAKCQHESNLVALLPLSHVQAVDSLDRSALHLVCSDRHHSEENAKRCAMLLAPHSNLKARDCSGRRPEQVANDVGLTDLGATLKGMRRAQKEARKIAKALPSVESLTAPKAQSFRL